MGEKDIFNSVNDENRQVSIPKAFLRKAYEIAGSSKNGRGLILCCLDGEGNPFLFTQCQSQVIEMGLRKHLENWLEQKNDSSLMFDFDSIADEDDS
jgi:hypothetical protein